MPFDPLGWRFRYRRLTHGAKSSPVSRFRRAAAMLRKLPIVAILGQGSPLAAERAGLAREAGRLVARLGAHLLTGGGYGVMEAAAEGFVGTPGRAGLSIGVIPRDPDGPFDSANRDSLGRVYPNAFVEIAVRTPLPPRSADWQLVPTRNHVNTLTADAILALPGGAGTRNELDMAAFYLGEANRWSAERRTVLLGPPDEFDAEHRRAFVLAATVAEAESHLRRALVHRAETPASFHAGASSG
jgi:predicted Rossmann-fold nucleotide-binding protein